MNDHQMIQADYAGQCPVCGHDLARTRPDPQRPSYLLDLTTGDIHGAHLP
jgi:hypothetical protein